MAKATTGLQTHGEREGDREVIHRVSKKIKASGYPDKWVDRKTREARDRNRQREEGRRP